MAYTPPNTSKRAKSNKIPNTELFDEAAGAALVSGAATTIGETAMGVPLLEMNGGAMGGRLATLAGALPAAEVVTRVAAALG